MLIAHQDLNQRKVETTIDSASYDVQQIVSFSKSVLLK